MRAPDVSFRCRKLRICFLIGKASAGMSMDPACQEISSMNRSLTMPIFRCIIDAREEEFTSCLA